MPRLDRFVDPLHQGLDYLKHRGEDAYDAAEHKGNWLTNLFKRREPTFTEQAERFGHTAGKIGRRVADTFSGRDYGRHEGYGSRGGLFGRSYEPSFFEHPIEYLEETFSTSIGPLFFVGWPLLLGLFISGWCHRQMRLNRGWYDKLTLPSNTLPTRLYDHVWTFVLAIMGYAAFLVFENSGFTGWIALGIYSFALTLLFAWPIVYFKSHNGVAAPIIATILSLTMLALTGIFGVYSGTASFLMALSTAWVMYMTVVNWQVFNLNFDLRDKDKGDWPWTATGGVNAAVPIAEGREAKKVR